MSKTSTKRGDMADIVDAIEKGTAKSARPRSPRNAIPDMSAIAEHA